MKIKYQHIRYFPSVIRYGQATIVPVTARKRKKALPTHIKVRGAGLPKKSIALLEQLRTIDKSRLKKIGNITRTSMNKIDKGLLISLGCFENRR